VLRLLVFGRSIDEAMTRSTTSLAFRLLENGPRLEPAVAVALKATDMGGASSNTAA
jgi:hypothetical protein